MILSRSVWDYVLMDSVLRLAVKMTISSALLDAYAFFYVRALSRSVPPSLNVYVPTHKHQRLCLITCQLAEAPQRRGPRPNVKHVKAIRAERCSDGLIEARVFAWFTHPALFPGASTLRCGSIYLATVTCIDGDVDVRE